MNYQKELDTALYAIKKAGERVLELYRQDLIIEEKVDHTYVTNADVQTDKIIREILQSNYPDYGLLTEESTDDLNRLNKDYVWIVDPIDGTNDFISKTDEFSINIALSYKNEIVVGVIYTPAKNVLAYAVKNQGAYLLKDNQTIPLKVNDKTDNLKLLVSRFFFNMDKKDMYLSSNLISTIEICGSSYKAIKIAAGEAELCIKDAPTTKEWDTAPMDIIIKEAGGVVTDYDGNIMYYNKEDTVNRNGWIMTNSQTSLQKYLTLVKNTSNH